MPKITGAKAVSARFERMAGKLKVEIVGEALFAGGEIIKAEARRSITQGAVSGANHVPSLPGEPPKNDSGILAAHINTIQTAPLRVEVESAAPYAAALEGGSKREAGTGSRSFSLESKKQGPIKVEFGDSKTAARPYMGPATRKKRREVITLIGKAVDIAISRK